MIEVHKAQPTFAEKPVDDLELSATDTFPDYFNDPEGSRRHHEHEAKLVVDALLASLPGGTVDAILRQLLEHRASLLRVRW